MTDVPSRSAQHVEQATLASVTVQSSLSSAVEARFFVISDLEAAIAQLSEIRGVRITAVDNEIDEIHVMSSKLIKPKPLVRNIETLLLVRFGVRVDHRRISIVQSDVKPDHQIARPIIHAINQTQEGDTRHISVELRSGGQRFIGTSTISDDSSAMQGGSLALIDAVEKLTARHGDLELREARAITLAGQELVLVMVAWRGATVEELFVGTAINAAGLAAAAARATLDAINRKLVRLPVVLAG
jgi:hypothetical protein